MQQSFFRVSVIYGAISIAQYVKTHMDCDIEIAVKRLREGPARSSGLDFNKAIELANLLEWDTFFEDSDSTAYLRRILKKMVYKFKPLWLQLTVQGRNAVKSVLDEDEKQCLKYANLIEPEIDASAVSWWDDIAAFARAERSYQQILTGREGERKSIEYEKERLKRIGILEEPIWQALDDSTAGYDILSYNYNEYKQKEELMIEVKTSRYSPIQINITQNEWRVAQQSASRYIFHIWELGSNTLRILTVSEIERHIPENRNAGKWTEARIKLPSILEDVMY